MEFHAPLLLLTLPVIALALLSGYVRNDRYFSEPRVWFYLQPGRAVPGAQQLQRELRSQRELWRFNAMPKVNSLSEKLRGSWR